MEYAGTQAHGVTANFNIWLSGGRGGELHQNFGGQVQKLCRALLPRAQSQGLSGGQGTELLPFLGVTLEWEPKCLVAGLSLVQSPSPAVTYLFPYTEHIWPLPKGRNPQIIPVTRTAQSSGSLRDVHSSPRSTDGSCWPGSLCGDDLLVFLWVP